MFQLQPGQFEMCSHKEKANERTVQKKKTKMGIENLHENRVYVCALRAKNGIALGALYSCKLFCVLCIAITMERIDQMARLTTQQGYHHHTITSSFIFVCYLFFMYIFFASSFS